MKNNKRRDDLGFTLAEVMVAAGLIGVLSLAVVNMMQNINKTSKRASQVFNINQEISRMSDILSNANSCAETMNGLSYGTPNPTAATTFPVASIERENSGGGFDTIYSVNDNLGGADGVVHIKSMAILGGSDAGASYLEGATNVKSTATKLRVTFRKGRFGAPGPTDEALKSSSMGQVELVRDIALTLVFNDATGAIVGCYSSSNQFVEAACTAFGGTVDSSGRCVEINVTSNSVAGDVGSNALTVGSGNSANIASHSTANVPLKVTRGGAAGIIMDDNVIQATTGAAATDLHLSPYGRSTYVGGAAASAISSNSTALRPPLIVDRGGTTRMSFDDNEIQTSTGSAAATMYLNYRGGGVTIGASTTTPLTVNGAARFNQAVTTYRAVTINTTSGSFLEVNAPSYLDGVTTIRNTINLGEGAASPVSRRMDIWDSSYLYFRDSAYMRFVSDERLKEDIVELEDVLSKFDEIHGFRYVWKKNGKKDIGYIAQELQKVFPEVVSEDEDGMLSVQYTKMPAINTAAIKELKKENDDLKFKLKLVMAALCNGDDAGKYEELCTFPVNPIE